MDRRHFLRLAGLSAGAAALPGELLAERIVRDPYAPWRDAVRPPVRVRGRVHVDGRGVANVRVSDGVSVVRSDRDGRYTLLADPLQPFVMISTPAGHEPARNAAGTCQWSGVLTHTASMDLSSSSFR